MNELHPAAIAEIERALARGLARRGPFELADREIHAWVDIWASLAHSWINGLREWRRTWLAHLDER